MVSLDAVHGITVNTTMRLRRAEGVVRPQRTERRAQHGGPHGFVQQHDIVRTSESTGIIDGVGGNQHRGNAPEFPPNAHLKIA